MTKGGGYQQDISEFGDVMSPSEALEPILSKPVRGALLQWLAEIFAAEDLAAVGVKPRRRAIFDGPPGVGKTTLAHHLAARLGLTMLAVRPERLIDTWVGSTGRNVGGLFDVVAQEQAARGEPILIFLDEFDALGSQRRTGTSHGAEDERNNYVNTLLQRIEQHDGFIIAATNYAKNIDQAIWRRFEMHISLELPGQGEREAILERYLSPFGLPPHPLKLFAEALGGASPALMRHLCEDLKRQIVLSPILDLDVGREATFERILASVHPHPNLGKPRLWSHAGKDVAVQQMPWPLPRLEDLPALAIAEAQTAPSADPAADTVISFPSRKEA